MIRVNTKGSFRKSLESLGRMVSPNVYADLDAFGRAGVALLANATPVDTGLTAASWDYEIHRIPGNKTQLHWVNYNVINGTPIAIILQYGHGTGTGGWVAGRDYINPAIQPLMDQIANDIFARFRA